MMTPLENAQRSQGGLNRAKNQDPADRKFQAMLAASRRPLLHDAKMTSDELLRAFKDLGADRRWIRFYIVSKDLSIIPHTLPDEVILRHLNGVGGAIGFLGVTLFGASLQLFYKPLRKGIEVIEKLDRVGRRVLAEIIELAEIRVGPIKGEVRKG